MSLRIFRSLSFLSLLLEFSSLFLASCTICYLQVIVGAHAVMANGGVIAPIGLNMVALAAKRHAVPFVVLAGIHKVVGVTKAVNVILHQN